MAARRRLKILQVMRAPVGGLFRHVSDLCSELSARGHQPGLIVDSLSGDAQTEAKLAALAPMTPLGIFRMAMPRLLGPGDLRLPLAVGRIARQTGADILHGHGAKGGFHARLAIAGPQVRRFYTPHGGVLHFGRDQVAGRAFHALERALMRRTDMILFESHYASRTYADLIGTPTCPVTVVHNGVREDEFIPVLPDVDARDFVYVGELRRLKGADVLIEALALLTQAGSRPTLWIVGDGPDRGVFEALAKARNLSDQITFAGAGPARAAFARGRIVVVPSRAESLPYIVLEAMAANRPVIATDVGGIPEIFGPDDAALVAAGDVGALASAMQTALAGVDDATQAERVQRIREGFSTSAMADAIEGHYQAAIGTA